LNFKIITAYPWWFLLLCITFGLVVSGLLYFRQKNIDFTGRLRWVLAILRFFSATILAFLLISPMVRTVKRTTMKPSVIIGLDNSSSIVMNKDSSFYRKEFLNKIQAMKEELGDDYEIQTFNFGDQITINETPDYSGQLSDISSFFQEVNTRYYNRNVGAVILATDGIYNSGSDPLYEVRNSKYPVFTINMGDTTSRKDLLIQQVNHNKIAYKGNRFPVEVEIQAIELPGEKGRISIMDGANLIFSQELNIASSNQVMNVSALIDAKDVGLKRYTVRLDAVQGEENARNNMREIFVEIRENRQKVAIITDAPHPDVAALQRVIENSNNYEVELFMANEFKRKPEAYSLIILNQLPSVNNPFTSMLKNIIDSKTPVLYIIGSRTNIPQFNTLNTGLLMANFKGSYNEALPVVNNGFSSFLYNDIQKKLLETVPPLISPFAVYNVANSVQIFAYQAIGSSRTAMPLILFNQCPDLRLGVIAGEGIWKWRMYDYITNNTHQNFDDLMGKVLQFLTVQSDRSKFRVTWNNFYTENENVEFNATLFNDSYEPITDPEIKLTITDESNKRFDYAFSASDQSYKLSVGTFPPGVYTFEATATIAGGDLKKKGSFVVAAINLEDVNIVANHKLLNIIASESGGASFNAHNFDELPNQINKREDIKPLTYTQNVFMDLIDFYPLMILLFLFFGLEWFLRKFYGSY